MDRTAIIEQETTRDSRIGRTLSVVAALFWPLQAAVIAAALAGLLEGGRPLPPLAAAGLYLALSVLRAAVGARAERHLNLHAATVVTALRREIIAVEARTAQPSAIGDSGALAALAAEKLEALRPYLLRYQPARLRVALVVPVILAIALWHSWAVGVVFLLAGPLIPVFMALVGWAARDASARQMGEIGQLSDLLVDRLFALADLRLLGAGPAVIESFRDASDTLRARTMAVLRVAFLSSAVLELFAALGIAMVAVWVGFSLLGELGWGTWGAPLTPFAGVFLLLLAPEFFQPLRDLAAAWHDKATVEAVLDEIATWRSEDRANIIGLDATAGPHRLRGSIRTETLAVTRGGREIRFPDLSVAAGNSIALTGPSGAGKSTLLRLLAGLEQPSAGQILVGDTVLDADSMNAWRAGLGWMPQAPHFLSRSLRYNIGFGASLGESILTRARLDGVIAALPSGLETRLGASGAGLSGGEARRVMLARALHGAPDVLLADEPTADLDPETAAAITGALLEFASAGGTLIVATHDRSLISQLKHIVSLAGEGAA